MRAKHATSTTAALEDLYRRRFDAFVHTSYAITRDTESSRDAVQEAFAVALRKQSTLRRGLSIESWIWRIVISRALDAARKRARTRSLSINDREVDTAIVDPEERDPDVTAAVRALPER